MVHVVTKCGKKIHIKSITLIPMNYTTPDQIPQDLSTLPACTPYEKLVISRAQVMRFLLLENPIRLMYNLHAVHEDRAWVPVDICHDMGERVIKILPVWSCILCPNSHIEKEPDEHDRAGDQYVIKCATQKDAVVARAPWMISGMRQSGLDNIPTPASCPFSLSTSDTSISETCVA